MLGGCVEEWHISSVEPSELNNRHQDCLMSSTQSSHGPCLRSVVHSLTCGFSGNVPLLLHVISFTTPSPALVLQATNTRVRRPGYKARNKLGAWLANNNNIHTQGVCIYAKPGSEQTVSTHIKGSSQGIKANMREMPG